MSSFFLTRVLETAESGGDRIAFRGHGGELSYADAGRVLRRLHASLGIAPGEVVALVGGNRPETLLAQFAIQLSGASVVLVGASSSIPDRLAMLEGAGVTTLVLDPEREHAAELAAAVGPDRVRELGYAADLLATEGESPVALPDSVRVIFPSGGTTGVPKLIAHTGMYDGIAHIFPWEPEAGNRILVVAPLSHMTGNAGALGGFLRGDLVVLHEKFDAGAVLDAIAAERLTHLSLTPPRLSALLDHPDLATTDLSSVRSLSLGASPLSPKRLSQALEVFGPVVGQGYGLTENPVVATIAAADFDSHPHRLASVGRIAPGTEAKIAGDVGEVLVKGLAMMDGYFGQPELTAAAFTEDGWLRTGDLGRFDEDGFLYLLDRTDDVIVTGEHGTKVYSTVVEHALLEHPRVEEAAVFGVDDGEQRVVHAVVVASGVTEEDLRAFLLAHFGAGHFVPKRIEFTDRLPLTGIGKIDKKKLLAMSK
ncbi:class I adenylate-forming enzyme family protein [Amycolatopsis sp. CA-230715]|uniref:class I adenylate-forming enzyme family protein n=1 Tax=Amycolatopsis sp. CA-230715 TaxID=2745196 RepID=UPI001C00C1A9|nr:AMP-binding protein [Amycolatopsis sp. CA-230715]QWF79369.1 Long-chain-fatty-acid--CoA ligase [Amycolatopsis sp. CA-230715]